MKEEKEISKLVTQWKRGDEDRRFTMAKISEEERARDMAKLREGKKTENGDRPTDYTSASREVRLNAARYKHSRFSVVGVAKRLVSEALEEPTRPTSSHEIPSPFFLSLRDPGNDHSLTAILVFRHPRFFLSLG